MIAPEKAAFGLCEMSKGYYLTPRRARRWAGLTRKAVIHKPARLSGAEVKFLRKHLGWSGADFAAHVGVDPTTVSAWENERKPFGTSSDRLLRLMVARQAPVEDYSLDELTKIADVQGPPRQVEIRSKDHGWQIAA
jgi:DNA-binding transcriptional regulator YiaG